MTNGSTSDLDAFDAVVWDLDGTLVRLQVSWDRVADDAAAVFESAGVDAAGKNLWEMLDLADRSDLRGEIETVIADHEQSGARESDRLPSADAVGRADTEAVCSLNCESACRVALETHELTPHIDAVVGRDTVATRKPDPEPLLDALRRLNAEPADAVFVGDSPRDSETADRAGVAFRYVDEA
ncbi:phosphoglycolate phosphatase [Halobellus salinus]|uniref:Phosphoglycolate phosphatase n=1 Tax=Halobellus salinus TaxID=931585 RepID=A0A830EDY4_9EURY|nr:HAD hydrolase-like protein [Halobellus salinus]GGJ16277.1 phosphoglycolate phosphatase [Halobellus salinus]SMP30472.1 phosphoglycolate phosphatase [Halobellus salinus]